MYVIAIGGQQVHSLAIARAAILTTRGTGGGGAGSGTGTANGIDENLRVVAMVIFQSAEMHGSTWLGIS